MGRKIEIDEQNVETLSGAEKEMVVLLEQWKKRKKRLRIFRYCLCVALICCSLSLGCVGYIYLYNQIPSVLRLKCGEEQIINFGVPLTGEMVEVSMGRASNVPREAITLDLNKNTTVKMDESKAYQMNVKLFGFLPFKQVGIQVIEDTCLTPMGVPIGIYVKSDGILVVGVGEFNGTDGIQYAPAQYILKTGDYILKFDGKEINSKREFIRKVEASEGKSIVLTIRRDEQIQEVEIKPVKNESGKYKIGVWLRDNAQGVGTMTYIDSEGNFGALGHGITDVDTSTLFELLDGTLYETEIISIQKGKHGEPGELTGMISYTSEYVMGDVDKNCEKGIFGVCNEKALEKAEQEALPIGLKQDIKVGAAKIYCTVEDTPTFYDIEITGLKMDNDNINRGIELKVTDPALLEITGGIVQGMSGSPIIQNGKIIGAVTHVLVNDPTRGYGIFIENMLEH